MCGVVDMRTRYWWGLDQNDVDVGEVCVVEVQVAMLVHVWLNDGVSDVVCMYVDGTVHDSP